jgi:hypothetical protein
MVADPCELIGQPGARIDVVQLCRDGRCCTERRCRPSDPAYRCSWGYRRGELLDERIRRIRRCRRTSLLCHAAR